MSRPRRTPTPLLRFLGAAGTVTGSRFLLETPHARVLVDCGLFQGLKQLRLRNWEPFPVDPKTIDAVVLTHAHVDHCGYLPALARAGFKGPIWATPGTRALCGIVLPDSGHLQEEDANYANRHGYSKHRPAKPLYTEQDAVRVLRQFRALGFGERTEVAKQVQATFSPAGHILGAASALLELGGTRVLVSGDLGRASHPILCPPAPPPETDFVLIESTYGDRRHEEAPLEDHFAEALVRTAERGGCAVVPSFAVDRTEVVLHVLRRLRAAGRIPPMPVYVDSPMALEALRVYRRAIEEHAPDVRLEFHGDGDPFDPGDLTEARSVEESKEISLERGPAVIISASGMATGGRVLHHLARCLPDPRNSVLLVGFQVEGTRGRALADGAPAVKMLGRYVPVRAEVVNLPNFSAHADQQELVDWLAASPRPPQMTFTVHGEVAAAAALRDAITARLRWPVATPRDLEVVRLD